MAGIAAAIIGAGALGAGASVFGALTQKSATNNAISAQQGMFGQALQQFQQAKELEQPFITAGTGAAGTLSDLLKPGADMSSILNNIPGMKFLQQLTQQGVSNQGTTTGLGGNTLLAGANAGSQLALSQGWQPIVNALQNLTNTGAGAAGNVQAGASALGGQAVQTGANIGGNIVGGANAIAGGTVGAANSIGSSLTSAALFNKLLNSGGTSAPTSMFGGAVPPGTLWYNS